MNPYCTILLTLLLFGTAYGDSSKKAPDWKQDPVLKSTLTLSLEVMEEYEAWAEEWTDNPRKPTREDLTINRVTESVFRCLINLLSVAPNPQLQEQGLRFLDTKVPSEFDEMWRFVFIEFSNVARNADGKPLQSDHLTNLKRRAMDVK
jgi:hypothetical protein